MADKSEMTGLINIIDSDLILLMKLIELRLWRFRLWVRLFDFLYCEHWFDGVFGDDVWKWIVVAVFICMEANFLVWVESYMFCWLFLVATAVVLRCPERVYWNFGWVNIGLAVVLIHLLQTFPQCFWPVCINVANFVLFCVCTSSLSTEIPHRLYMNDNLSWADKFDTLLSPVS